MAGWEQYLNDRQAHALDEFLEFLRIPSISALPAHAADVQRAAEWVANRMLRAGLERVEVMPTGGHPVIYGEWLNAPGQPTLLLYGHFDVQPVDPLDLWTSPPFEPRLERHPEGDRLYARGASDMKGNLLMILLALEALLASEGRLPVNIKCLFEGQEEIGSPQLPAFIAANRARLACDLIINGDGGQWSESEPALGVGTKGICGVQVDVKGANSDLHSGIYGGAVANPLHALVAILASLRDADNRIRVAGFYDQVVPISAADRALIAAVPFDEAAYMAQIGVTDLTPEAGYSPIEHLWARPTLELNGIWGGFQGEGTKTVLPNLAHAKITCRLVADQEPTVICQRLIEHIQRHAPRGVTVSVTPLETGASPYLVPSEHWGNQAADRVLSELYGRRPYYVRSGGSVPVLALFLKQLGAYAVSFGFSLKDEQIHAPNEFCRVQTLARGQIAFGRLFKQLGAARG